MIVAIDGPSAAGKSSTAAKLAEKLNFVHVNTGNFYRRIAYLCLQNKVKPEDVSQAVALAKTVDFENIPQTGLFSKQVNQAVADYSMIPELRQVVERAQKQIANKQNIVMEGRDIGTVIFPQAEFKFFLTADPETRAKRRFHDVKNKQNITLEQVRKTLTERDLTDKTRKISPLKQATDAILIDSSGLTLEQVVEKMCAVINCTR